jgi:hypothetical protein
MVLSLYQLDRQHLGRQERVSDGGCQILPMAHHRSACDEKVAQQFIAKRVDLENNLERKRRQRKREKASPKIRRERGGGLPQSLKALATTNNPRLGRRLI